jgi:hypothetical protein
MARRFIPDSDQEFADMARGFVKAVSQSPQRYTLSETDVEILARTVSAFEDARMKAAAPATRTWSTIALKDELRQEAERIVRRLGAVIRASNKISPSDKRAAGVRERSKTLKTGKVPDALPILRYSRSIGEGGTNSTVHELKFTPGFDIRGEQPRDGAVRIELFADLVEPGAPIPSHPGEFLGGRPWYLGSFTKSPIKVAPPIPPVPMLAVYWVRWADSRCRVGRFSKTCQGGWVGARQATQATLPASVMTVRQLQNDPKQIALVTPFRERYLQDLREEPKLLPDAEASRDAA